LEFCNLRVARLFSPFTFTGCPIGFARRLFVGMGLLCVTAAQLWPDLTAFPVSSEFDYKERQTSVPILLRTISCKLNSSIGLRHKSVMAKISE
jgi:hypothetical protein